MDITYPVTREDRGLFPLSELSTRSAADFGEHIATRIWTGKEYREYTYSEFHDRIVSIARWLIDAGIKSGDKIAVLGDNSPEWACAYLGIQTAGGVVIPVDRLLPGNGIRHILSASGATFLFSSSKYISQLEELERLPELKTVVSFDHHSSKDTIHLQKVLDDGKASDCELPERDLDELAAILYTSGTTGMSKGVMLSQRNIMSNVAAASRTLPLDTKDTFLSVLPMHHTYECTAGFLFPIYVGSSITYARSLKSNDILTDIRETGVTIMVAVPLLYEKMHAGILRGIRKKGVAARTVFQTLFNTVTAGEKIGLKLGRKLFRGIRGKAGLGSVVYFISGGGH